MACARPSCRAQRQPHALGRRQLGIDVGQPLLCLEHRVPELDEGIARDEVRGRLVGGVGGRIAAVSETFSFSSSTIRSAVFFPIPGIAWKRA